jgi:hypothetical protein
VQLTRAIALTVPWVLLAAGTSIGLTLLVATPPTASRAAMTGSGAADWVVRRAETGGAVSAVTVVDDRAYVGIGGHLVVLDVRPQLSVPAVLRTETLGGVAKRIVVHDGHAFVALGRDGLEVYDLAAPRRLATPGDVRDLWASGDRLYTLDSTRVWAWDITDPFQPVLRGEVDLGGQPVALTGADGFLYVPDFAIGLHVVDVRGAAAPTIAQTLHIPVVDVAVRDHYAYTTSASTVQVVDLARMPLPAVVATVDLPPGPTGAVTLDGTTLLVGTGDTDLALVDVSSPTRPRLVGTSAGPAVAVHSGSGRAALARGLAYLPAWDGGLRLVDFTDPDRPHEVATWGNAYVAADVAVDAGHVYVAAQAGGLRILEASSDLSKEVGRLTGEVIAHLAVQDGYVYAVSETEFIVIDARDPARPRVAGRVAGLDGWPVAVALDGDHAFVAASQGGLQVFDVRDPASPAQVGLFETLGPVTSVDVAGGRAYITDGSALRVLDLSNPARPRESGALSLPGWVWRVRVSGSHAFVIDMGTGEPGGDLQTRAEESGGTLDVVDVSDPAAPRLVATRPVPSKAELALAGGVAYIAGDEGLQVLDVSTPTAPQVLGHHPWARGARGIAVSGPHVFLAMWTRGLQELWASAGPPGDATRTPTPPATPLPGTTTFPTTPPTPTATPGPTATTLPATGGTIYLPATLRGYRIGALQNSRRGVGGALIRPVPADRPGISPSSALAPARPLTDTETIVLETVAGNWPPPQCAGDVDVSGNTYTLRCNLAAGHMFTAWIERRATDEDAAAAFAAFVGAGKDVREFHYFVSSAWQVDEHPENPQMPMRTRYHAWHASRWFFGVASFDDTAYEIAPAPLAVAEQVYQSAQVAELFPLSIEGTVLKRMGEAWRDAPLMCPPTILFLGSGGYLYRCPLWADWSAPYFGATILPYATESEARDGFEGMRGGDPVELFHGLSTVIRRYDPSTGGSYMWLAGRRVFTAYTRSDTLPQAEAIAERLYEAAVWAGVIASEPVTPGWDVEHLWETGGAVSAVAVVDDRAYVGIGGHLVVLDVSPHLSAPVVLRTETLGGVAEAIAVAAGHVFVALGDDGMSVYDLDEPRSLGSSGSVHDLIVSGRRLYTLDAGWLEVWEITDPVQPNRLGMLNLAGEPVALAESGGYVYVANRQRGLQVIDARDPSAPDWAAEIDVPAVDVAVLDHYVYVVSDQSLAVFDVADPTAPAVAGSLALTDHAARTVTADGTRLYLGTVDAGLTVYDASDPTAPRILGERFRPATGSTRAARIAVAGGIAYLAGWDGGLVIMDVTDPTDPQEVGAWGDAFMPTDVAVAAPYVYVAAHTGGLRVFEVTDRLKPKGIGRLAVHIDDLCVQDGYVYAVNPSQLLVIDAGDPTAPVHVGTADLTPGAPSSLVVADGYAFVAASQGGLQVFDVRDPATPRAVGTYRPVGPVTDVDVAGGFAYVTDGGALRIVDVSNPAAPAEVAAVTLPGWIWRVRVDEPYAYVSSLGGDGEEGALYVVDITNRMAPRSVVAHPIPYDSEITLRGGVAYLAGAGGIRLVDVTTPTRPRRLGGYSKARGARGIAVAGDLIVLAMSDRGLLALWTGPLAPVEPTPTPPAGAGTIWLPAALRGFRIE